jgi:N-acetylmuramoyl-L-alanine amidase
VATDLESILMADDDREDDLAERAAFGNVQKVVRIHANAFGDHRP